MAANAIASAKGMAEAEKKPAAPAASTSGGIKPWLPVLANLILMPILAYGTVSFLILPKLTGKEHSTTTAPAAAAHGSEPAGVIKHTIPLAEKVLVNVAGTMGTRFLVSSLTLVASSAEVKTKVEQSDAELRDAIASVLSVKTISDLEKPGARNLIRTELVSVCNNILGAGSVTDIYLTEFAVQ